MTYRKSEFAIAGALAVTALAVYATTLCRTVTFIDSGELAADIYTLGIPHPTGYPLFTLIGYLFTHIPFAERVIVRANCMAAVLCAGGVFLFFRFMLLAVTVVGKGGVSPARNGAEPLRKEEFFRSFVPAIAATLILAFSETYWSQALSIEVYSLHLVFLAALLYLFAKSAVADATQDAGRKGEITQKPSWRLFAFVLGLAFTNHMTTILLAPAFLAGFFAVNALTKPGTWRKLRSQVIPFLLGLSPYIYLPVRAATRPLMNWGNPSDWERFLWHFSGKVYRVWIFSSFESAGKQFNYFVGSLPGEFAYLPLFLAVAGIWMLFRTNRRTFVFTLLLFFGCVGYAINYDIHDIDSYFLLAYVTVALWCGVGAAALAARWKEFRVGAAVALTIIALVPAVVNYSRVDQHHSAIVENYSNDMLGSFAQNGLVISYQWDYFVSAGYYLQLVEGVRPDVTIIDKELLRRTWYLEQLEHRYPELMRRSKQEIDAFKGELFKFEHGLPYDGNLIEYRYAGVIRSLLEKNMGERPVYVTPEIEAQYYEGFAKTPAGLAFRLSKGRIETTAPETPKFTPIDQKESGIYVEAMRAFYAQSYLNYSIYWTLNRDTTSAIAYLGKALEVKADYGEALAWKRRIGGL